MRSLAKTRLAGLCAATLAQSLLCGVATSRAADDGGLVINDQLQFGDVFSTQILNVEEAPEGLSASAIAVGNIVSGVTEQRKLDFQSDQELRSKVGATVNATVNGATEDGFSTMASATGNSATAGTCCEITIGSSIQTIAAGAEITADSRSRTYGPGDSISMDATAVGNTQGWNQRGGELDTWTDQTNDGLTAAGANASFFSATGNAGITATAVANNVTVDSRDAPVDVGLQQLRSGMTSATVDVALGASTDSQAVATATGNLIDASTSGHAANLYAIQTGSGELEARTGLRLDDWTGNASAIGYGVGNSILLSSIGPSTTMHTEQVSDGDIYGAVNFTGGAGRDVTVNATAMGNAVSGYACFECGGDFSATNRQTNGSRVRSQSNVVVTGRAGPINADAVAVGNSATYRVFSNED